MWPLRRAREHHAQLLAPTLCDRVGQSCAARSITTRVTSGSGWLTATRTRWTSPWFTPSVAGTPRDHGDALEVEQHARRAGPATSSTLDATSRRCPTAQSPSPSGSAIGRTAVSGSPQSSVLARLTRGARSAAAGAGRRRMTGATPAPPGGGRLPPGRSSSTKMRLRDVRTRCRAGRSRRRARAPPARRRRRCRLDAARPDRRLHRAERHAREALGPRVAQVDEHRERVGLAGQIGHRLGGFDEDRSSCRRPGGAKWPALRESPAAERRRTAAGSRPSRRQTERPHKSSVTAAHHLLSPPAKELAHLALLLERQRIVDLLQDDDELRRNASRSCRRPAAARTDREHLAGGPEHHGDPGALALEDAAHRPVRR